MIRARRRPRPVEGIAAGNKEQALSYPLLADLQAAGDRYAEVLRDLEERFLAALWHSIPDATFTALDVFFDDFAFEENGELYRVLLALGDCGRSEPEPGEVMVVLRKGFPESFIRFPDQLERIRWVEVCGAGLHTYARLIRIARRRREQVCRLWRVLRDRLKDPFAEQRRNSMPIVVRRASPVRPRPPGRLASCR